jgi:YidC/Oxa1 family membrane protein insertase
VIDTILNAFEAALTFLHDIFVTPFGENAWGWAIIALTLVVRIALLPLAIKQTRSMRAMQALQPQIKELQKKYKVDRDLMRKDPEQYKAKKAKLNEEMMALYQREGANPAASCLPLLAQAPIFLALFYTLRRSDDLTGAPFYFFTRYVPEEGLAGIVSNASWPGWLLIVLMSGTMFISQKQMMARTAATPGADSNPMAQQQKILLYVMPVFLAVISFQFPLGILLYWVTTNFWQVAQQWIILREVQHEVEEGTLADKPGGGAAARWMRNRRNRGEAEPESGGSSAPPRRISPGASSGKKKQLPPTTGDPGPLGGGHDAPTDDTTSGNGGSRDAAAGTTSASSGADDEPPGSSATGGGDEPSGLRGEPVDDHRSGGDGSNRAAPGSRTNGAMPEEGTSASRREHLPRRRRGGGSSD